MANPRISIIMSVYNNERFLDESISSILNQTFKDFEFIIVNDHSTDGPSEIIERYQKRDKRIKLIKNKKNIGLTRSLNKGMKIAKGQYIARQDADDISLLKRLRKQFEFLEKNKDIFLCGTNAFIIDENGKELPNDIKIIKDYNIIKKALPVRNCFVHTSIMFRNQSIFYREKFAYSQDYDLYLNLLTKKYRLSNLEEKLVKSRYHSRAITFDRSNQQKLFALKAREFYLQRMNFSKDEYEKFNPDEILKIKKGNSKKVLLEGKIGLFLKNKRHNKAKECFKEYKKVKGVSLFNIISYYIYTHFPITYRIYRKVVYRDDFKE